jgi:2-keto-4-pentenoate hydratase/2-oxohepta-3-ene-1,7-dioic acid hydratase in catechol pathway
MRLVNFGHHDQEHIGAQVVTQDGRFILDLNHALPNLPSDLGLLLEAGASALERAREALAKTDGTALIPESSVTLLPPIQRPGKIICMGYNYWGHTAAGGADVPAHPNMFCKTANTIIGPQQPIILPHVSQQVDYEAELAVIIGTRGHAIPESDALQHVAGYSIFNDVSARDYQNRSSQWLLGKSFDTFGPLGPALVTIDEVPDPHNLDLELTINGVPGQRANTRDMIFRIPFLIAYLSQVMTLDPGDIIATGTPSKLPEAAKLQRFLQPGDVVAITIEKLGTLTNTLVESERR